MMISNKMSLIQISKNKCDTSCILSLNEMNTKIKSFTPKTTVLVRKNKTIQRGRTILHVPSILGKSFFTILAFVCLETVLLSTMSTCAKTFYMHWNTTNSIFRIDNTDHIIDVNKGNLPFEFDQVHIICPVYEPGTFENETEKYIIYNVSKVEYETCRITNADPRVIAICDKPHRLMFFTITFRPFTPQPGGLEFLPGNDYYFISTSSKDDLYRRIGGRCSTNNMKVVFKVCCSAEDKNKTTLLSSKTYVINNNNSVGVTKTNLVGSNVDDSGTIDSTLKHSINNGYPHLNVENNHLNIEPININKDGGGTLDQFNRIPMQTGGTNSGVGIGNQNGNGHIPGYGNMNVKANNGISSTSISQYPAVHSQGNKRINNYAPQQIYPSHKSPSGDHYDKHPNEVVKNEELTYNSGCASLHSIMYINWLQDWLKLPKRMRSFFQFVESTSATLSYEINLRTFRNYLHIYNFLDWHAIKLTFAMLWIVIFIYIYIWRYDFIKGSKRKSYFLAFFAKPRKVVNENVGYNSAVSNNR